MLHLLRLRWLGMVFLAACLLIGLTATVNSQPPATAPAEPAAPEGQTYTGSKQCSSCHFKQYLSWKKTKHAKESWENLPQKYRADATCLPCHTTGYGQPTGFTDIAATPNLAGTTCEACHGPGSEHEKVCKQYANKKQLSPDEEKAARDSIYRILPNTICARCHIVQGHKEMPKFDKE